MGGGWPAFFAALSMIGLVTFIVGEVAGLFGCCLGISDAVTAITFVALGTSLPDTFASVSAARSSVGADSAVGNITGSNSVNVFLGLGLPYLYAVIFNAPCPYNTPPGGLVFSVVVYLITSVTTLLFLGFRRYTIGGELGGPRKTAYMSSAFLVSLWLAFLIACIINSS